MTPLCSKFIQYFRNQLPVKKRRLYFLTFQPHQKGKHYLKWSQSCNKLKDFIKRYVDTFVIVKELCKSGKPHFHAVILAQPNVIFKLETSKLKIHTSINVVKTHSSLTACQYDLEQYLRANLFQQKVQDILGYPESKHDEEFAALHYFNLKHVNTVRYHNYKEEFGRRKARQTDWDTHPYKKDIVRLCYYISKDLNGDSTLYKDYYVHD